MKNIYKNLNLIIISAIAIIYFSCSKDDLKGVDFSDFNCDETWCTEDVPGGVKIVGYGGVITSDFEIPEKIKGKNVVEISGVKNTLLGIFGQSYLNGKEKTITNLNLSKAIFLKSIDNYAFSYCVAVKNIMLPNSVGKDR